MLRWTPFVLVVWAATAATEEAPRAGAPPSDAEVVVGGDDARYRLLRSRLAAGTPADAIAVLDAVRAQARRSDPSGGTLLQDWISEVPLTDARSAEEAAVLRRELAEVSPWTVRVEAHFLRIPRCSSGVSVEEAGPVRVVPGDVASRLLGGGRADGIRHEAVGADALSGQTLALALAARARYLMDYDVEIGGPVRPMIGAVECGSRLVVTPRRVESRPDRVRMRVRLHRGDVLWPVPLFETSLLTGARPATVTIQLPEVRMTTIDAEVEAPLDGWVLATVRSMPDEPDVGAALLHVRRAPSRPRTVAR
jgi:hypothetical protein